MSYVAAESAPQLATGSIKLHNAEAFEGMRRAGQLAAEVLDFITPHVQAGISTEELDRISYAFIMDHNALPAT